MDFQQLDVLENKIELTVRLMGQLRKENAVLRDEANQAKEESQSKEMLIQQLQEENKSLALVQNETILGKEKEEEIRSRVEQMLSKLDELEHL